MIKIDPGKVLMQIVVYAHRLFKFSIEFTMHQMTRTHQIFHKQSKETASKIWFDILKAEETETKKIKKN